MAKAVDFTALPGTKHWDELSMDERAQWWVTRIGGLNTVGVAFPNIFGLWARRLPVTTVLGFVNQAMVLVAVAREYRVTDRERQVELLASVLGNRAITPSRPDPGPRRDSGGGQTQVPAQGDVGDCPHLQGGVDEMGKRPQPARVLRWFVLVPVVGAPFAYAGERLALQHAVNAGRAWIVAHPEAIAHPPKNAEPR